MITKCKLGKLLQTLSPHHVCNEGFKQNKREQDTGGLSVLFQGSHWWFQQRKSLPFPAVNTLLSVKHFYT